MWKHTIVDIKYIESLLVKYQEIAFTFYAVDMVSRRLSASTSLLRGGRIRLLGFEGTTFALKAIACVPSSAIKRSCLMVNLRLFTFLDRL